MGIRNRLQRLLSGLPDPAEERISQSLRDKFARKYNIVVGLYSYGWADRSRVDPNTTIGRYCSFAENVVILNRNHPPEFISTTPYLYNASLGMVPADRAQYLSCEIGDDVWIGRNAAIAPSCRKIGRGAIIGAGAVVTKDVEPYTVVAGVPAAKIRDRFKPEVVEQIQASRWWEWSLEELQKNIEENPDLVFRAEEYFETLK